MLPEQVPTACYADTAPIPGVREAAVMCRCESGCTTAVCRVHGCSTRMVRSFDTISAFLGMAGRALCLCQLPPAQNSD